MALSNCSVYNEFVAYSEQPSSIVNTSGVDRVRLDSDIISSSFATDHLLQSHNRTFLAASPATPATPRNSVKRPRSSSDADSSSVICHSSSPARMSTPLSSPQSSQSVILESSDRSKRLRIDDTIVVETQDGAAGSEQCSRNWNGVALGHEHEGHTLLDYILGRIQPIPKLETVTELLQDEMDAFSKDYRAQIHSIKFLRDDMKSAEDLMRRNYDRHEVRLDSLLENHTLHDTQITFLEEAKDAQSSVLANTKGRIAEVEAKLIAVEERIEKEICDVKIDKQIESVNASAGKSGSYEKLKAKCRKLEERLLNMEQNTTMGKSMYRLLDSNTKYTRELNDGVNSWKKQSEKEHLDNKLLQKQVTTLEERTSTMEKLIRNQQTLIADLASQLHLQRKNRIPETPMKQEWKR